MEECQRTETRVVDVYDIMGSGTTSSGPRNVTSPPSPTRSQRNNFVRRQSHHERNSSRGRSGRTDIFFFIGDAAGLRISTFCCLCGVLATAVGACLILIYLISEYSPPLKNLLSSQGLIISGLVLLFLGIFAAFVGVYFCWIYKKRSHEVRHINRNDELEAGFHQSLRRRRGCNNPAMVPDEPPSYNDLAEGSNLSLPLPISGEDSCKPPSYVDAVELYEKVKDEKSEAAESPDNIPSDISPPPYGND